MKKASGDLNVKGSGEIKQNNMRYHVLTKWGGEYEITKEDLDSVVKDIEGLSKSTIFIMNKGKLYLKYGEIAGFIMEE